MNNAIALEERFTDLELAQMFNVDCSPNRKPSSKVRHYDEAYALNDIKSPLWKIRKNTKQVSRGRKHAMQTVDHIADGVTTHEPGSDRVADLAAFYNLAESFGDDAPSPFNI